MGHELWTSVTDNVFRDTKVSKNGNLSSVVCKGVGSSEKEINLMNFENRMIMIKMIMLSWDSGRSVMKSMARFDQGQAGMSIGRSLPAGKVQGTLDTAQVLHVPVNLWISPCLLGLQYLV